MFLHPRPERVFLIIVLILTIFVQISKSNGFDESEFSLKLQNSVLSDTIELSDSSPTPAPTSIDYSNLPYYIITVAKPGIYVGRTLRKQFVITSGGTVRITGSSGISYYKLSPVANATLIITDFKVKLDILDLSQFPEAYDIDRLNYAEYPVTIYLNNNQEIIFSSWKKWNFTTSNFVFSDPPKAPSSSTGPVLSSDVLSAISILGGLMLSTLIGYQVYHNYYHKTLSEKLKEKVARSKANSANSSFRSDTSQTRGTKSKKAARGPSGSFRSEKGSRRITNDFVQPEDHQTVAEQGTYDAENPPEVMVSSASSTSSDDAEITRIRVKRPTLPPMPVVIEELDHDDSNEVHRFSPVGSRRARSIDL
jgi:hypothetical protein